MGRIDYLDEPYGPFNELDARVRKLETANPIGSSSMTKGQLRIGGSGVLLVDSSGGLVVHGSINGDGTITWSGTFTLSGLTKLLGTTSFEGDTTQKGPFHVQGNSDFTGTVLINGDATLLKNLLVNDPGKITIDGSVPMVMGKLASGAAGIRWGAAYPQLYGDSASATLGVSIQNSLYSLLASTGMNFSGKSISIDATSHLISGLVTSALSPNLVVDPATNRLYRSSSALRYKKNIRTVHHDERLLRKVSVVLFDDVNTDAKNIPGVIAEVVAKNGGEPYVRRGADGKIEGVQYDRLALTRTAILANENDKLRTEIQELRAETDSLRAQVEELAAIVRQGQQAAER